MTAPFPAYFSGINPDLPPACAALSIDALRAVRVTDTCTAAEPQFCRPLPVNRAHSGRISKEYFPRVSPLRVSCRTRFPELQIQRNTPASALSLRYLNLYLPQAVVLWTCLPVPPDAAFFPARPDAITGPSWTAIGQALAPGGIPARLRRWPARSFHSARR